MLQLDIKDNIRDVESKLRGFEKQIPFAVASGLTSTGKVVKKAERDEIVRVFDQPTARTKSSIYLRWATKRDLSALVWIVEDAVKGTPPIKYLTPEVEGGRRNRTRFEKALIRAGILGANEYVIPSKYAKKNKFGNITAGTYTRVLSQLSASPDQYQNRSGSKRSKQSRATAYFVKRTGKARGIWERKGKIAKPLFIFTTKRPSYRKRFDFNSVAERTATKHLPIEMNKSVIRAMATARVR